MRVGRNPAKAMAWAKGGGELTPPPPVSVGLLTHAPFLAGYHSDQLEVIRLAVTSAKVNAGQPVHLVVADNGSCAEVREWLVGALADGLIDQLVLNARNLGKVTALSQILLGSPGPDVVYADGDLLFRPGWLAPMLAVRDAFPEAGIIGGAPALPGNVADDIPEPVVPALPDDIAVERGRFVDDGYIREWLSETGLEGDVLESRLDKVTSVDDVGIVRDGVRALLGSPHCQFLLTAPARRALEPQVGRHALKSAETHSFDDTLNELGFLRLSVQDAVYRHVGNRPTPTDLAALAELESRERPSSSAASTPLTSPIWGLTPVRRMARRLHHWSFRVLYESEPGPWPRR